MQKEKEALEIYDTYAQTEYGQFLSGRARYDRLRPSVCSLKSWERLIGPDANNLRHMHRTIVVARWFIKRENLISPKSIKKRDAVLLAVTAAMHDQAEAIVGDVPRGRKTEAMRQKELKVLREHEAEFAPRVKGFALGLYRTGRDRIAFSDPRRNLPGAFKTIELIGFLQNAIRAYHRTLQLPDFAIGSKKAKYFGIHSVKERNSYILQLRRLYIEVIGSGIIETMIALGKRFPSAHAFLRIHKKDISNAFENVKDEDFEWYDTEDIGAQPNESKIRRKKFYTQRVLWQEWLTAYNN